MTLRTNILIVALVLGLLGADGCGSSAPRPADLVLNLGGGVKLELVLIPAGKFMMGSPAGEKGRLDEETQHEATISRPFYLGRYDVTQEQYERIASASPSRWKGAQNRVERVSWYDAQEFCKKLSTTSGKTIRLPTEAEWEYACRAGSTTAFCFGDNEAGLASYAWYDGNSAGKPHPVGEKKPNAWGLYDMHGNVWEWCQDWWRDYPVGAQTDPAGPASGAHRVLRGGGAGSNAATCRSAKRCPYVPDCRELDFGFRVVVSASPKVP